MKHVHTYSTRYDTFLEKNILERDGKSIAHIRSKEIAEELVKKLNESFGEEEKTLDDG